jgi:VCBS repeat-containing protein
VLEGNVGDAPVTATGSIAISDIDADDSPAFNNVAATLGDNSYGSFTLTSGTWTYTLDQAAIQNLDAGDVVNDTITYTATDGSTQQITVGITGADDDAIITGTVAGAVLEGNVGDAPVTATGSIAISDVDDDDSPTFSNVAATLGDNSYGTFTLTSGTWTYSLDQSAVQNLDAGDVVNDTITYTATDGSTQQISVAITGSNDTAIITGTVAGAVLEGNVGDAPVTATGSIALSDVDDDDSPVFNNVAATLGDNSYGSFILTSGTWTYTLDQAAVQNLDAGDVVNDTITYTATDGSTQQISVAITGSNDDAIITGTVAGAVFEGNVGDAPVTATGSIAISDVDGDDSPVFNNVAATLGDNSYGSFTLTAGTWTYTLDQAAIQNLDAGDVVNDTITYTATDGSTQQITVAITGANDNAIITGTVAGAVLEGNVGDPPVTATGAIAISDVDADDSPVFNNVAATLGDNSYGSFTLTSGTWTYTLDQAAVQSLDAGDVLNDTITYTATDGSTQQITVAITGANDNAVITGTVAGAVVEGNVGDAPVTATGAIAISDVDADDAPAFNNVAATLGDNSYGSFTLASGTWTYTLDQAAVQDLDAGDVANDTITYTATDGSTQQITVAITGSNDNAIITGTVAGAVLEGNVGDTPVTATGSIAISDVDADDSPTFSNVAATLGDNSYGTFTLTSGTWAYSLDQSAVQNLDAGDVVNDTITYTATDGSTQQIGVAITGSNDDAIITGTVAGAVLEGNVGDAPVTATGSIAYSGEADHSFQLKPITCSG